MTGSGDERSRRLRRYKYRAALSGVAFDWLLTRFFTREEGAVSTLHCAQHFLRKTRQQHWSESNESQGSKIFVQKRADCLWPATSFQLSLTGHSKRHRTKISGGISRLLWESQGLNILVMTCVYALTAMLASEIRAHAISRPGMEKSR